MKHWYEQRGVADAPAHYDLDQAKAWVAGWNACIEAFKEREDDAWSEDLR